MFQSYIPIVNGNGGAIEIGRYLDFHFGSSVEDFDGRLYVADNKELRYIPGGTGVDSKVWTQGNGGSGSGLDAGLLEGHAAIYFLPAGSYTAADVLAKVKTVDGAGSDLDADLVRGKVAVAADGSVPFTGPLSMGAITGQRVYVYDGGSNKAGFGIDLSGNSNELTLFHSAGAAGRISFGARTDGSGAYTERMALLGDGTLLLNGNSVYHGGNKPYTTGTYTGNGAGNRTIATGYNPSAVFAFPSGATTGSPTGTTYATGNSGLAVSGSELKNASNLSILGVGAGGFFVDSTLNTTGLIYNYVAFKQ